MSNKSSSIVVVYSFAETDLLSENIGLYVIIIANASYSAS